MMGKSRQIVKPRIDSRRIRLEFFLLSCLLYVTWLFFALQNEVVAGFGLTYLLPLAFILVFFSLLWTPLFGGRGPFAISYTVVEMFRFVVLSAVTVSAVSDQGLAVFGRNYYSSNQLDIAAVLMIYELVVTAIAVYCLSDRKHESGERSITCEFYTPIYLAVVAFAIVTVAVIPSARSGLTFLTSFNQDSDTSKLSTAILLVRELFVTAKYFIFFVAIKWVCKKDANGKVVQNASSAIVLCLSSLLVIGIRIGTNRKRIIADAIACAVIIFLEFPKYRKRLIAFFAAAAFVLVASTSIFRGATASFGSLMGDLFEAGSLQSYLCGQYNIAAAIETRNLFSQSIDIGTFVYTTFRSFFGIGTLISGLDIPTLSEYFNQVASTNYTYLRESQIIPTVGEGYIYFGMLASPVLSLAVVWIGTKVDKLYRKASKVEVLFILLVIAVYLGQGLVLTSNIIVNNLTFKLALFIPIVFAANTLMGKQRERSR